jgi:hypothetical protein
LKNIDIEQWRHIREKMDDSHSDNTKSKPLEIDIKDPPKKLEWKKIDSNKSDSTD